MANNGCAFCFIYCPSTDRFLLELRGEHVGNPRTWGLFGGHIEDGETPDEGVSRELWEEASFSALEFDGRVRLRFSKRRSKLWVFLKIVDDEFNPTLSAESLAFGWFHDFPKASLHPKLAKYKAWLESFLSSARKNR